MTETQKQLRRLAVLEGISFSTWGQVLEWYQLRRWVLTCGLLDEYREQHYFSCSEEVTKIELAPKKSSSMFSRFLTLFRVEI
jgi:hypothetical protein